MPAVVSAGTAAEPWRLDRARRSIRQRLRLVGYAVLLVGAFFAVNWVYQVVRKPTELLVPLSPVFVKTPAGTWAAYRDLFRQHATDLVSAELLGALAHAEASGNPIAGTYWRWQWSMHPFELYRPASSAVGMFQITDATFRDASRSCGREAPVAPERRGQDARGCWLASLYARIVPSSAVELTAGYLHRSILGTLGRQRAARATVEQKQRLAAVVHLCGVQRGAVFARRGFRPVPAERCGDHDLQRYLDRIQALAAQFAELEGARPTRAASR